jgi:hypothetical protein
MSDCKHKNARMLISVTIDMPLKLRPLTKSIIRRREVELKAVHWNAADYYCPDCDMLLNKADT